MFKTLSLNDQSQIFDEIQHGVHLFHFDFSNCSQRVRICLIEKGIDWRSRPVNLLLNEHSKEWFQKINPKGLVPVLSDNGNIVTESVDIIRYLESMDTTSPLQPKDIEALDSMNAIIELADGVQSEIKLLTHYFLAKPQRFIVKMTLKKFSDQHGNSELVKFKRRFANNEFTVSEVQEAIDSMHGKCRLLEACLTNQEWMVDSGFSLADVAWMVNIHRLDLMGFPLTGYPNILAWYERSKERRSFQEGLVDYEPAMIMIFFRITKFFTKTKNKRLFGFV
ncbi:hypothetical protein A9Q99_16845 [Gammaproteobacteria bacterium 45_16_T64]|nr:hypothetical protein A9Q99_16845 [Gammaproteobacteria bacterium 45_16_T64]